MNGHAFYGESFTELIGLDMADARLQAIYARINSSPPVVADEEDDTEDTFIEFKEEGVSFAFEQGVLIQISLFADGAEPGYSGFRGSLPLETRFEQTKAQLLSQPGTPEASGGGKIGYFGPIPEWVRYASQAVGIHFAFSEDLAMIKSVAVLRLPQGQRKGR